MILEEHQFLAELIAAKQSGFQIVALKAGLERGLVKIEIGIGHGKKLYDKRDSIKQREQSREIARHHKA